MRRELFTVKAPADFQGSVPFRDETCHRDCSPSKIIVFESEWSNEGLDCGKSKCVGNMKSENEPTKWQQWAREELNLINWYLRCHSSVTHKSKS